MASVNVGVDFHRAVSYLESVPERRTARRRPRSYDELMKRAPRLTVARFIEALCAAHLSSYVGGYAEDRGGIMVVGPPNSLKSTMVGVLDKFYHDAVVLSDVNMQMLAQLRDTISQGAIR